MRILLLFLLFSSSVTWSQVAYSELFSNDFSIEEIKAYDDHYLILVDDLRPGNFSDATNHLTASCCQDGLVYMDFDLQVKWVYTHKDAGISDFIENENGVSVLLGSRTMTKTSSSKKLWQVNLNEHGKERRSNFILEKKFPSPNSDLYSHYLESGGFWTSISSDLITVSSDRIHKTDYLNLTLWDDKGAVIKSHEIYGNFLELKSMLSTGQKMVFLFSGSSIFLNNEAIDNSTFASETKPGLLYLEFDKDGTNTHQTYFASGHGSIEGAYLQNDELIIFGEYPGYETDLQGIDFFIGSENLADRITHISDERDYQRSYLASFSNDLQLNWLTHISPHNTIMNNSLSVCGDTIVVAVAFQNHVSINGTKIRGKTKKPEYHYEDPIIIYFSRKGELLGYEQPFGEYPNVKEVYLFPDHFFVRGSFLYHIQIFGHQMESESINSVSYMVIQDR